MQAQILGSHPAAPSRGAARVHPLAAAVVAVLLGGFLIWGVGFSSIPALHNAAHDTRHSLAFPCH